MKVLRIYIPEACEHQAKEGDVIHYHYVGRLSKDGSIFGKRFVLSSSTAGAYWQGIPKEVIAHVLFALQECDQVQKDVAISI